MAVAADFFWNCGEGDGDVMIGQAKVSQNLRYQNLIVFDQLPLGAALFCVTENIESGAAQSFKRGEPTETAA